LKRRQETDGMNERAVKNIKDHITLEMAKCEKCEQMAIEDKASKELIEMYHDMISLYAGFLAQL